MPNQRKQKGPGRPATPGTLYGEQTRRTRVEAELKELELAQRRKELAPISEVMDLMGRVLVNVKQRLLAIPIKAAPLLAACRTEAEHQNVLAVQIDEALHELDGLPFLSAHHTGPGDGAASSAAPAPDGQRMGGSVSHAVARKQRRARAMEH